MADVDPEIEHAQRVRDHMNEDHANALADYVRHYLRRDVYVAAPVLERITHNDMLISWAEGAVDDTKQRRRTTVPFDPPMRDGSEARSRLVAMAGQSAVARIPTPQLPPLAISIFIAVSLPLLGLVAYRPDVTPKVVRLVYDAAFLYSRTAQRATAVLSLIAHLAEGVYSCVLMARVTSWRTLAHSRAVFWAVQTTVFGFPSLTLLIGGLRAINRPARRKAS